MFQTRFAPLVESGAKLTTIRPMRKRPVRVGDVIDARAWAGLPYRSKQRKLRTSEAVEVLPIDLPAFGNVWLGGRKLNWEEIHELARGDGFRDMSELFDWIARTHGLPFKGTFHRWRME